MAHQEIIANVDWSTFSVSNRVINNQHYDHRVSDDYSSGTLMARNLKMAPFWVLTNGINSSPCWAINIKAPHRVVHGFIWKGLLNPEETRQVFFFPLTAARFVVRYCHLHGKQMLSSIEFLLSSIAVEKLSLNVRQSWQNEELSRRHMCKIACQ